MFYNDADRYVDGLFTKVQIQWISRFREVLRTLTCSVDMQSSFSFGFKHFEK